MNIYKKKYLNHKGFSLIELTVVIIMIGILAITVLPKFQSSKGFEEYTYRDELINKLRSIQLRTMQQTNDAACQYINVSASKIGLLATIKDINTNTITCSNDFAGDTTTVSIVSDNNIQFSISENLSTFKFSSMGQPIGCIFATPCKITLTITGDNTLSILINSEGYIYAL
jgi:MSHA pilin protein MshC